MSEILPQPSEPSEERQPVNLSKGTPAAASEAPKVKKGKKKSKATQPATVEPTGGHIQENTPELSRAQKLGRFATEKWKDRPSLLEFHYVYIPIGVIVVAAAVGVADRTFDLHIADSMASVCPSQDDNPAWRYIEERIHEIGVEADGEDKPCITIEAPTENP